MSFLRRLDVVPGWKTGVTAALYALFSVLRVFGVVELTEDQASAINGLALALISLFLAVKIERTSEQ